MIHVYPINYKQLFLISVLIESALIIRVIIYITTASENFYLAEHLLNKSYKGLTYNIKMPYSIIIAYVGLFVAITGCVLGCVHHSSLKRRNREHQGQNQASAAYPPSVEPTNQQNHMHYMEYGQPPYEQHLYEQPPYGRNKEHETQNQASAAYAPNVELTHQPHHMHYMEYGQPPYEQPPHGQPSYEQPPYVQPPYGRNKEHQRQNQASAAYAPTVELYLSSGWTKVDGSVYI